MRALLVLVALLGLVAATAPAAQPAFTREELTVSPPHLLHGSRDVAARIDRHERLAAVAESSGDEPRAARHFAIACQTRSMAAVDLALSHDTCHKARALADRHNLVEVRVLFKAAEGSMRAIGGGFGPGIAMIKEAIAMGASLDPDRPDHSAINAAHHFLGVLLLESGQFDASRQALTFARDHLRTAGNAIGAAWADLFLCRLHTMLGDFSAARAACDVAEAEMSIDNDIQLRANLSWMRGTLYAFMSRPAESLAELQKAWAFAESPDGAGLRPIVMQLMVDAFLRLKRVDEAEAMLQRVEAGLKTGEIPFFFAPQAAMRRGQVAVARLQFDEAEAAFNRASRSLIHEMSIRAYGAVARMNRVRGNYPQARAALESAIARIERSRTSVTGSSLRSTYLTLHANAYRDLVGVRWAAEGNASAAALLDVAEAGRARALLDQLGSAQVSGATALTLKAAEIQSALGPEDVLVEYVSSEDSLIAITVTRERVAATRLENAGSQQDLRRRVEFFATLAQEDDEAALAPAAKRLYDDLLAPALTGVTTSARTLIIAADGPLHSLPFDAIGGTERVIDRWNVVTVPSASTLRGRPRDTAPTMAALVVAAPATAPSLPPLAAAPQEAAAIRRRVGGSIAELSGTAATKQQLQSQDPGRFAVLHFASHAVVDEEHPLRSSLVLAAENGADVRWSAEEIYRSRLNADLVVLAACSTAAGATSPGEGVMSLSRAFLYAGAGATIATLWDVPDAPGPVFADVLYRELASGQTLGAAAAEARRELRRRGAPPRVWASYVVTGNPNARVSISPRAGQRLVLAAVAGGIALLLLIGAMIVRRSPAGRWVTWRPLAAASALLALLAIGLPALPESAAGADLSSAVERGNEMAPMSVMIANRTATWAGIASADEHVVELFDAEGVASGEAPAVTSPYRLPESTHTRWLRVVARRDGRAIAWSNLMRVQP